ncbi:hypothetical protein [Streptomyces sp. NPDC051132]|uniref:hypothetical protein n=1 Tax=unclassified Streptomyces TaxID=2593676 RepID=UPI003443D3A6
MTSRTGGEDAGATRSFDFTALARGRTTVRLLHCPLDTCTGPNPGDRATPAGPASPYPTLTGVPHAHAGAAFHSFTITVH